MDQTLIRRRVVAGLVLGVVMGLAAQRAPAFSLLGPYADWMQPDIGYHGQYDIGGPMDFDEGYRWNVPIVTYGFDQSFVDYFGANGVAAVESAIAVLNDLPPASSLVLSNYPLAGKNLNNPAAGQGLVDLKTFTLSLLLDHLGLVGLDQATEDLLASLTGDPQLARALNNVLAVTPMGWPEDAAKLSKAAKAAGCMKFPKLGYRGTKPYRDALKKIGRGGPRVDLGFTPTREQTLQLLKDAGIDLSSPDLRIEGAHMTPPHDYPHINYPTPAGGKGTVQIQ